MGPSLKDYDVDEACIFISCIGLGSKIGPFRENGIDGDMLVTLTHEDLTGDLCLSNLQAKKVLRAVQEGSSGGGNNDGEIAAKMQALEAENAQLKSQITALKRKLQPPAAPAPRPAPAPAPAPAPPQQHHRQQGPGVVGGAAVGAAGGAMKGAIAGAILPGMSAADGAKAGAAVGATTGGLRGLRNRRRRF